MLSALVSSSLRFRALVLGVAAILMVWGAQIVLTTPYDVFPEFARPRVEIQTEGPGLSAEEIESLVTTPLENALTGTSGLETLHSKSVQGLSSVTLFFEPDTDLANARQFVQERVTFVTPQLPDVADPPVILQPLSSTSRALKIGLWMDSEAKEDLIALSELCKWTVRPRLMALEGVANVAIWGQRDRQFQVRVDPDRLRANGITLRDLEQAVAEAARVDTGGFIDTPNQRLAIRHVSPIVSPHDLEQAIVAVRTGAPLRVGDVADVVVDHPPRIGGAIINDQQGMLLIVEKELNGNTLQVTHDVEAAMKELEPALRGIHFDTTIFRPATFIESSRENLGHALLIGVALVVLILAMFLFDWRTGFISLVAIPLSVAGAFVVLHFLGGTVNVMILAGLVIAIGEVVDDAIIDVENIARRMRLNRLAGNPESAFSVVLHASLEVRGAVVYASLIIVVVLVPIFLMTGLLGTFFRPLALAYVLAIAASLLVALTVTPALALLLLPSMPSREREAPLARLLKAGYRRILPLFTGRPKSIVAALLGSFVLAAFLSLQSGMEMLPSFKETDFLMHWVLKSGASVEEMDRITIRASKELRAIPGVRNFGSHNGRAEVADEVVGANFTELWISVDEEADYDETVSRVEEVVYGYPGLRRDVLTYLKERMKEVLTHSSATVVVRIFGPDLSALRRHASLVKEAIATVPGVIDLKVEAQVNVPQIEVRLRPEAAAIHGLTSGQVRRSAVTLIRGQKVGEVFDQQKIYDVVIWGVDELRTDLDAIRRLPVDTPSGGQIPLGDLAEIRILPTPNSITREGASRKIDVSFNVSGERDLGSVAREAEEKVRAVPFERGYHPEVLGEYTELMSAVRQIALPLVGVLLGILVLLHAVFQSLRLSLLVLSTLLLALPIGCVLGVLAGGSIISMGSIVGVLTVLGIAARNGILLVSHYQHLEQVEGMTFGIEMIRRGAEERLVPIVMTASSTGLALLPLAISGDLPGYEIEYPMALVILGGLITSTLLNLFFLPALYLRYGRTALEQPAAGG